MSFVRLSVNIALIFFFGLTGMARAANSSRSCAIFLERPHFSVAGLSGKYLKVPVARVFTDEEAKVLRDKLLALTSNGEMTERQRMELGLLPLERVDSSANATFRTIVGDEAFHRLWTYYEEASDLFRERIPGTVHYMRVSLNVVSRQDIRASIGIDGNPIGGHVHDPYIVDGRVFANITVTKAELGPGTITFEGKGRLVTQSTDVALILTDAWHASPDTGEEGRLAVFFEILIEPSQPSK